MVPPRSRTSFCSGSRSITGYGSRDRTPWSSRRPCPPRAARTRPPRSAFRGRSRGRNLLLARANRAARLALDAADPEAAGDQDAVAGVELALGLVTPEALGVDPADLQTAAVVDGSVAQGLDHRQVGVLELHVLADEPDAHRLGGGVFALHERLPLRQVGRIGREVEVLQHLVVDALGAEVERHLVDRVHVAGRDDGVDRQVHEQGDLLTDLARQGALRAAHDHVRLDADPAQLLDRVLGRLRLELPGVAEEGHEGEVHEHALPPAPVHLELAQRLEEGQRLDVAHRAADLGDHEVDVLSLGHEPDPLLDLVGDVGITWTVPPM